VPKSSGIIVAGEALVDIALGDRDDAGAMRMTGRAGGSPANVAVGLARLGVRTQMAARIAPDGFGPFLRRHLKDSGVDTSLCINAEEPATVAIVDVDSRGVAGYSFYVEGTADWQWEEAELPRLASVAAVHSGSLAIAFEPGGQVLACWIAEQRARGDVLVSLDPNVRAALVLDRPGYRERLDGLIAQAHLVKVSDEDLRALEPGAEPLVTAAAWSENGPDLVVVTHGADGSTALVAGSEPVYCAGTKVKVRDTIGAGDAFTAGLLAFFDEHEALGAHSARIRDPQLLAEALPFANRVAAFTCTRAGADPPRRSELDAW
jgi:fructokinase